MTANHALVVYESEFGNTRQIATAIAEGISTTWGGASSVGVAAAGHLDPSWLGAVRLLVVGAPTHAFSLPRQQTREGAADQGATEVPTSGVREWLDDVSRPDHPVIAATFDTRAQVMRHLPGSAATAAKRRLRRRGFEVADHESFYVLSTSGPLAPGEEDRARDWGETIAREAVVATPQRVDEDRS
jgi:hypothetical protein